MHKTDSQPRRVLILCTRNSARSQMAEALFATDGGARIHAESAGSHPGPGVHPVAVEALAEIGIDWAGRGAQGIDDIADAPWDAVITVCDAARDACPILPGAKLSVHWGLEDPAAAVGHDAQLIAFREARDKLRAAVAAFLDVLNVAGGPRDQASLRKALNAGQQVIDATE